jgi:hypothetical protein
MRPSSKTQVGNGASAWMPLDHNAANFGLFAEVLSGGPTYSVEITPDNVYDPAVTATAYPCQIVALTAATTTQDGLLTLPCVAVRINITGGGGTVKLTAVPGGTPI